MWEILSKIPFWIWLLFVWDIFMKLFGLWRSARNNHLAWFICIAVFNTVGILPLIYILTHKQREDS